MISNDIYELLGETLSNKYDTYYLELAPDDADCPYIEMHTLYEDMSNFKDCDSGNFNLNVHVWSDRTDKRRQIASILDDIYIIAKQLKIKNHSIMCLCKGKDIITDDTTSTIYLHGVITLNFKYI